MLIRQCCHPSIYFLSSSWSLNPSEWLTVNLSNNSKRELGDSVKSSSAPKRALSSPPKFTVKSVNNLELFRTAQVCQECLLNVSSQFLFAIYHNFLDRVLNRHFGQQFGWNFLSTEWMKVKFTYKCKGFWSESTLRNWYDIENTYHVSNIFSSRGPSFEDCRSCWSRWCLCAKAYCMEILP